MTREELDDRTYPDRPIVGVGAVILGERGVLLVKRDKDPGKGLWSVPGGLVELGETQVEAVKREVLEETGLRVEVLRLIDTYDLIERDEAGRVVFHYVINHYLTREVDGPQEPRAETEAAWFRPDDLPGSDVPDPIVGLVLRAVLMT